MSKKIKFYTTTARDFYNYLHKKEKKSKMTALDYATVVDNYLNDYARGEEYSITNIEKFMEKIDDRKYMYKFALKSYILFLAKTKKIDIKTAKKILKKINKIKVKKAERKELRTLTREQYETLIREIIKAKKYKLLLVMLIAYDTGARISAILKIRKRDIRYDEQNKVWQVTLQEKGGKVFEAPLSNQTMKILSKILKNRKDEEYILFKGRTKLNIEDIIHERMRLRNQLLYFARKYLKLKSIGFHYIRRLAGLELYYATGKNIVAVQRYFRHENPKITARYLRIQDEDILNAWKKRIKENPPIPQR